MIETSTFFDSIICVSSPAVHITTVYRQSDIFQHFDVVVHNTHGYLITSVIEISH